MKFSIYQTAVVAILCGLVSTLQAASTVNVSARDIGGSVK